MRKRDGSELTFAGNDPQGERRKEQIQKRRKENKTNGETVKGNGTKSRRWVQRKKKGARKGQI